MEFDISKVYTAVNADELQIGSKIIPADNLHDLKIKVTNNCEPAVLRLIKDESCQLRFAVACDNWALVYLVEEPAKLKWTDLKVGDTVQKDHCRSMVTLIDADHEIHVHINSCPMSDDGLKQWRKVND